MKLIVKTFFGLEETLANEIKDIGGKDIQIGKRSVSFNATKKIMYRSNLELRTALRVLQPMLTFKAYNETELYQKIYNYKWSSYLNCDDTFAIDAVAFSKKFTHSKFVSLKIKDAIVDQFRDNGGERPSVDTEFPTIRISVHVSDVNFTISLDSSGDSLHKRGYRSNRHQAPINEVLAAGMIKLSGWDGKTPLIDPMCGTGTIPIEAGLLAINIPALYFRRHFGFMNWGNYDKDLWEEVREEAKVRFNSLSSPIVFGSDDSIRAFNMAEEACEKINLDNVVSFANKKFEQTAANSDCGHVIINPPYGERLRPDDIDALYKGIGDKLKQDYAGHEAWIISSNLEAMKKIGLRATRRIKLFNGSLECQFQQFKLYKGTKKIHKLQND